MVQPTPFDRLIQEVSQQAARDPQAAFARLDEVYGKSLTADDVVRLGALAVHLGAAGLGRWQDTALFQHRLLEHPAVASDESSRRSLFRGLAVVLRCAGDSAAADRAVAMGATTPSERCRLAVMSAQTLAARGRFADCLPYLRETAELLQTLPPSDEIVAQSAAIAGNLARLAEGQLRLGQDLVGAATGTLVAASLVQGEWRRHHRALYQRGRAFLLAADPGRCLTVVQRMMTIEDERDAGPSERFHTASLACRAQAIRGQFKIANGALEAARDFAGRCPTEKGITATLEELERYLVVMREGVAKG